MAISQFKATCLAVLERVRKTGQPLLVTKRGEPIAQVLPPPPPAPAEESRFGCMRGTLEIVADIVQPLPEEVYDLTLVTVDRHLQEASWLPTLTA